MRVDMGGACMRGLDTVCTLRGLGILVRATVNRRAVREKLAETGGSGLAAPDLLGVGRG